MTGVELVKLLTRNGFEFVKAKGSHYRMVKDNIVVFVPYHHKELGKGLENAVMRKAGLK